MRITLVLDTIEVWVFDPSIFVLVHLGSTDHTKAFMPG